MNTFNNETIQNECDTANNLRSSATFSGHNLSQLRAHEEKTGHDAKCAAGQPHPPTIYLCLQTCKHIFY